ncbi:MAG TPA: ribonuclease H-like domain-containing protein [Candidatus Acidoferrales bacterium]|nr:ribonuclease H-like domain-containing protein [Candidatus Acidoferrales bacterium]
MASIRDDQFNRLSALKPARTAEPKRKRQDPATPGYSTAIPQSAEHLARLVGASPQKTRFGEHLALRRWFSDPPPCDVALPSVRLIAPGAPEEAADPRNWLFLDTETTGLSGGTGTYAFLIGIAWWDAGGLEVEQFFMRDHSEEHSVLIALKERLAERRVLVTFNGKSFDWPLLETRYRMTRSISVKPPRAHLDLLHPARHLWRQRIGSVRLSELERHVLGRNRGSDIVSDLIPQIYFDYLRGGSVESLVPVFYHNQMDLVGLAALAGRVCSLLAAPESQSTDVLEIFGVSRICDQRGESARARDLYAHAIARELPQPADGTARAALARLAKREGDFARAISLWMDLRGATRVGLEAYVELAKYYEHRARQPLRAAELIDEALRELRRARTFGSASPDCTIGLRTELGKRMSRLQLKCGKPRASRLWPPDFTESRPGAGESK